MPIVFNKIKIKSNLKLILFCNLVFCSLVNCGVVLKRSQRVRSVIQFNDSYINPELTKVSLINKIKELCDKGVHLLVSDVVCAKQLAHLCNEPEILLRMLDASSKYSGMIPGARFDYGNFDECININYDYEYGQLGGKYCPFSFLIPDAETGLSNWNNIFKLSLCIPDGCSLKIFSNITSKFQDGEFNMAEIEAMCVTKASFKELGLGNIVVMSLFMLWFGIIIICTIYDIYQYVMGKRSDDNIISKFSMYYNYKKLLNINGNSPNRIDVLDGLRAISMIWIIAFHGFSSWIDRFPASNQTDIAKFQKMLYSSYANAAHLCVDTFFYMSGFLVAFNYLKSEAKAMIFQIKAIPYFYLNRYIRLTTALLILFFIDVWIYPKLGTGPMWIPTTNKEAQICKTYWWTFFLYIQNYYNYDEMCVIPTWYLSADMQMYILAPIVLIPLSILINRKGRVVLSMVILGLLNIFLTVFPMIIRYNKESPNTFDTHSRLIDFSMGLTMGAFMQKTRTLPYLHCVEKKYFKTFNLLFWIIVLTQMFLLVLLYTPAEITMNRNFNILYFGLSRPAWCIGLSWIIYSCYHGYGSVVNWILTRPVFKLLAKMAYSMYLLHYPVIGHYILSLRTRIFFSDYHEFYLFCGYFTETFLLSIFWILVFEYPIFAVENELRRKNIKPKDSK